MGAFVRALTIDLGRVFLRLEVDIEQGSVGYFRAVVINVDCLGVAGGTGFYFFVGWVFAGAASIAGNGICNALYAFKQGFLVPEAAGGKGGLAVFRQILWGGVFCEVISDLLCGFIRDGLATGCEGGARREGDRDPAARRGPRGPRAGAGQGGRLHPPGWSHP